MSVESATRFLRAAAQDQSIREKFDTVTSPEDFLKVSHALGYCFTVPELREIVSEQSKGVMLRRPTGVWKWLRSINWIEQRSSTSRYADTLKKLVNV